MDDESQAGTHSVYRSRKSGAYGDVYCQAGQQLNGSLLART
jgi:hypothetical protein